MPLYASPEASKQIDETAKAIGEIVNEYITGYKEGVLADAIRSMPQDPTMGAPSPLFAAKIVNPQGGLSRLLNAWFPGMYKKLDEIPEHVEFKRGKPGEAASAGTTRMYGTNPGVGETIRVKLWPENIFGSFPNKYYVDELADTLIHESQHAVDFSKSAKSPKWWESTGIPMYADKLQEAALRDIALPPNQYNKLEFLSPRVIGRWQRIYSKQLYPNPEEALNHLIMEQLSENATKAGIKKGTIKAGKQTIEGGGSEAKKLIERRKGEH